MVFRTLLDVPSTRKFKSNPLEIHQHSLQKHLRYGPCGTLHFVLGLASGKFNNY